MTQMLQFWHREFKIAMIMMLNVPREKVDDMQKQIVMYQGAGSSKVESKWNTRNQQHCHRNEEHLVCLTDSKLTPSLQHRDGSRRQKPSAPRKSWFFILIFQIFYLFGLFFFAFSRAAPEAYGGSQARGLIRATAASPSHSHSHARSEPCLQPTPQFTATPDP